jgi:hypothetical protein
MPSLSAARARLPVSMNARRISSLRKVMASSTRTDMTAFRE